MGMRGRTVARESRGPAFIGPDGVQGAEAIKGRCQPKITLGMVPNLTYSTIWSARTVKPRARSVSASFGCNLNLVQSLTVPARFTTPIIGHHVRNEDK